jgi:4-amino-4-deoxy-L-arabinose transferase-like glycosyltransferase
MSISDETARAQEHTAPWLMVAGWVLGAALLRTLLSASVPLLPDETYYWEWTRRLEGGYFDHPPGIALLITLGVTLFGNTVAGVRAGPAIAMATRPLAGRDRKARRVQGREYDRSSRRHDLLVISAPGPGDWRHAGRIGEI